MGRIGRPPGKDPVATTSFSLTVPLVQWISEQAEKRGISKSLVVRDAVIAFKAETEKEQIAA